MLKNLNIISRLTDSQKVKMLTGAASLNGKDMKILGIPEIRPADMKDYGRGLFPGATSLSNAWDEEVWQEVANRKAEMMIKDKVNLILTPGPKIKLSPYRREISEDTYLASTFSASHLRAVRAKGVRAAITGFYLTDSDVRWMDKNPNERVINELLVSPFADCLEGEGARIAVTDIRKPNEAYRDTSAMLHRLISDDAEYLICKKASDENTVELIMNGVICLEGSENALESAIAKYKKLKRSIEDNEGATLEQLKQEQSVGNAISMEKVDEALDRLIDFLHYCADIEVQSCNYADETGTAFSLEAALSSCVLLKNKNGTLPLSKSDRIAVIGDIIASDDGELEGHAAVARELDRRGYYCVGSAKGYKIGTEAASGTLSSALSLAQKADTVILYLGFGYEAEKKIPKTEKLSIPAEQLYLVEKLFAQRVKVIAVLSSGHAPDVEFTRNCEAVLFAPLEIRDSAEATVKILCGEVNPSGKLAYTLYSGSDVALAKSAVYREKYGMRSGPFVGYRYYDTAEITVGYPFGHGLSYTSFKYSSLNIEDGNISFYIENVGDVAGTEVAQIYVGAVDSPIVRPKKELCCFRRISLNPGEKKKVSLAIRIPYVSKDGTLYSPGGEYCIYVGSSVSDIRLQRRILIDGVRPESDNERLVDYLQSISNVKEDNYTLEAGYSFMKRSVKNILFGIAFIALAISVAIFNSITDHPSLFVGVIGGVLAVISILFFVAEAAERSRLYEEERAKIDQANNESFEQATELPFFSTDKMFHDEFDNARTDLVVEEELKDLKDDEDAYRYVDKNFGILSAAEELKSFLRCKGYKLADLVAENLLASISTSSLSITSGMSSEDFTGVVRSLCEYFGTDAFIDAADKKNDGDSSFFSYDYHGDHSKKSLLLALEYARENPAKLVIAALDGADINLLEEYITPFAKYLYSGKNVNKILITNESGATVTYNIAPNLRLFVNLDRSISLDSLPKYISALGSFLSLEFIKCKKEEITVSARELNRHQIAYFAEKESTCADISEEAWKKIDKLEKYVGRFSDYRIGNKLWNGFEKHTGLLLSCGLEITEALDVAVSTRLLPSASVALKDKLGEEDQTLSDTVEFVLGEEKADYSKRFLARTVFEYIEKTETHGDENGLNAEANSVSDIADEEKVGSDLPSAVEDEHAVSPESDSLAEQNSYSDTYGDVETEETVEEVSENGSDE